MFAAYVRLKYKFKGQNKAFHDKLYNNILKIFEETTPSISNLKSKTPSYNGLLSSHKKGKDLIIVNSFIEQHKIRMFQCK